MANMSPEDLKRMQAQMASMDPAMLAQMQRQSNHNPSRTTRSVHYLLTSSCAGGMGGMDMQAAQNAVRLILETSVETIY